QLRLQRVKDVSKVNLVGLQDQKIWIELSNTKAVQMGVPVTAIQEALAKQNSVCGVLAAKCSATSPTTTGESDDRARAPVGLRIAHTDMSERRH
ncbi:efflux RND transporter permease subunit, partial [Mycobacterium tuberculosis]|nr:efflux RND transporter permease subunit [Mycobacterium tuberculosis]